MKSFGHLLAFLLTLQSISTSFALLCPPPDQIAPCYCVAELNSLACMGTGVTQEVITNFFSLLRPLNGIGEGEWLEIPNFGFQIVETGLTTLDLSPLFYTELAGISFDKNYDLHTLYSSVDIPGEGQIRISSLILFFTSLTNEGLDNVFTYFDPLRLTQLDLVYNEIVGGQFEIGDGSGDVELIRGFSSLTHLEELDLTGTKITIFEGGQFKRNVRLRSINSQHQRVVLVGENAFTLDPCPSIEACPQRQGQILINGNQLTSDAIHPNHGMDTWGRGLRVYIDENPIESLPQATWENFLLANDGTNELSGRSNKFYCTSEMKWLKDRREEFESRVHNVICENDPNRGSIFSTEIELLDPPALKCPPADSLGHCTCSWISTTIECDGADVTQLDIDNAFQAFRSLNNIADGSFVDIFSFTIQRTQLTTLDITPFFYTRFDILEIYMNSQLDTILGGPTNSSGDWVIETRRLNLGSNKLTDEGLGSTLQLFSPNMTELTMNFNEFVGGQHVIPDGSGDIEMFQGLGSLVNLDRLEISYNKLSSLSGGQFKRNTKLGFLNIGNNEMTNWGENAFLTQPDDASDGTFYIYALYNSLVDENLHPNHGLGSWQRRIELTLDDNQFEYLSEEVWKEFLFANNHTNKVWFYTNNFFCDQRMKWLKDGREDFEERVKAVYCTNDQGETIFTTDLV